MHIPDGFLSPEVAAAAAAASVATVGIALRRAERELDERAVPLLGVTGAFVFGATLAAVLLGPWLACLVMAVVLTSQAFVFADGGITALGANVLNMGIIGALVAGAAVRWLPRERGAFLAGVGIVAWVGVMLGATATSLELASSGTVSLGTVLPAMLGVHALIGVGEAAITVAAVGAVLASRADLVRTRPIAVTS
jgi:cobalt/nickel transport system permease protein